MESTSCRVCIEAGDSLVRTDDRWFVEMDVITEMSDGQSVVSVMHEACSMLGVEFKPRGELDPRDDTGLVRREGLEADGTASMEAAAT